ncbi:MAG: hypothetical protein ABI699_15125 [Caldimonas sp.]
MPWKQCDCGGTGVACACNPKNAVMWRTVFAALPQEPDDFLEGGRRRSRGAGSGTAGPTSGTAGPTSGASGPT